MVRCEEGRECGERVQEAVAQAAAAMEAVQVVRGEVQGALGVLQQQVDPAESLAAAKRVSAVSASVAELDAAAQLTKASVRALEEQAHGLRASTTEVQQRLSALNQRGTDLERSIQVRRAMAWQSCICMAVRHSKRQQPCAVGLM